MTSPLLPAAMISLVAVAAAHDRRDRAAALWLGMALAFSMWALLPAAPILAAIARRHTLHRALPVGALALAMSTLILSLADKPHSLAALGLAGPACLVLATLVALARPWLRAPRAVLLGHRA